MSSIWNTSQIQEFDSWEYSSLERGQSPRRIWPLTRRAGVKIIHRIFDCSPNPFGGKVFQVRKWRQSPFWSQTPLLLPCVGKEIWFIFPTVWYSRKKLLQLTMIRCGSWDEDTGRTQFDEEIFECQSMFKGQRTNVVSTAPGGGGCCRRKTFDAAMRVSRGFEIMYGMARARERIRDSP